MSLTIMALVLEPLNNSITGMDDTPKTYINKICVTILEYENFQDFFER